MFPSEYDDFSLKSVNIAKKTGPFYKQEHHSPPKIDILLYLSVLQKSKGL